MVDLIHGDCRDVLATFPVNHFGSCNTDPPYEIGILGEKWDKTGVAFDVRTWKAVCRVLKPGAYLTAFCAPKRYHRLATAIEGGGFVIRDTLTWLKGGANMPKGGRPGPAIDKMLGKDRPVVGARVLSGTAALSTKERGGTHSVGVDSRGARKEVPITAAGSEQSAMWDGWGYNLKPAQELICLAQKPFKCSAAACLVHWGVGALNVDAGGAPGNGRDVQQWPPGVVVTHDPRCIEGGECHPECPSRIIGEQSGSCPSAGNTKPTTGCGGAHGGMGRREWSIEEVSKGDSGTAARYFPTFRYSVKASKSEKTMGGLLGKCPVVSVKPIPVVRWLTQLTTPPGQRGLDPFLGSGTTGIAHDELGLDFVGIEQKEEHLAYARARIKLASERRRHNG